MKFTVLGGAGFIGGHLVRHLRQQGHEVLTPPRSVASLRGEKLGHVIYAIGLTGDFRTRLKETIEAHVDVLQRLMDGADFESWLYLSSTRVYGGLAKDQKATEDAVLSLKPSLDSLYDLSKLLGEAICLATGNAKVRIARLSNVYGAGQSEHTFLGSIIRDAATRGKVSIGEAPGSSKDYISVSDVAGYLAKIAAQGTERLYNVASSRPVTHQQLADVIRKCGCPVEFVTGAPVRAFPALDTARLVSEFGHPAHSVIEDIPALIDEMKTFQGDSHAKAQKKR